MPGTRPPTPGPLAPRPRAPGAPPPAPAPTTMIGVPETADTDA